MGAEITEEGFDLMGCGENLGGDLGFVWTGRLHAQVNDGAFCEVWDFGLSGDGELEGFLGVVGSGHS